MLINSEGAAGIMKDIAQTQSFKDFSIYNYIYIDKTEQIYNLLKTRRVFISRPRRFGKSLMLDTIGTLFAEGVDPISKIPGSMTGGLTESIRYSG